MSWAASAMSRAAVVTHTRPLRYAVLLKEPVSPQAFRTAVGHLCGIWGGTRSVIVSANESDPLEPKWRPAIQALDPDVVVLGRGFAGGKTRLRLVTELERLGCAPFWMGSYEETLVGPSMRRPIPVPVPGTEERVSLQRSEPLMPVKPVHVAVLGFARGRRGMGGSAADRATADRLPSTTLPLGTPAHNAARLVPGFSTVPSIIAPFLYHTSDGIEVAMQIWNYRAIRGPLLHGGDGKLERHLSLLRSSRAKLQVVALEGLTARARDILARHPGEVEEVSPGAFQYLEPRRVLPPGTDRELDTVAVDEGSFGIPVRAPVLPNAGQRYAGRTSFGAYAIEIEAVLDDGLGRRISLPPRKSTGQLLVPPYRSGFGGPPPRLWSRARKNGDSVLAVAPMRNRTIPLALPTMANVLESLMPQVRVWLGDKGRYGRWVAHHAEGLAQLHDLLTEPKSGAMLRSLIPQETEPKSTRVFSTLGNLESLLRSARADGRAGPKGRYTRKDRDWLHQWIDRLVATGLLRCGLEVQCTECLATSFLDLSTFGLNYTCPRCGRSSPVPARPELGYQLAEVAHLFFANDCDVTALATAAMARKARGGFSYDFDHYVRWPKELKPREFDFTGVIDGQLFVGESKSVGKFERKDVDLLVRLARSSQARYVVLATGTECEGGCGSQCARALDGVGDIADTCLPSGTGSPGVRERVQSARATLDKIGAQLIVLCRGDLTAPLFPESPQ